MFFWGKSMGKSWEIPVKCYEVRVAKCWSQLQDEMSGAHLHLFGAALPRLDWRYLWAEKSQNTV